MSWHVAEMSVSLVENQFLPHGVFPNLCKNKEEKWTIIVIQSSVWISHGGGQATEMFPLHGP